MASASSSSSSSLQQQQHIDVVVDGNRILYSYNESTTIASLASDMIAEWQQYNPSALKYLKYVKDHCGKIIPGTFRIADIADRQEFEVVLQEIDIDTSKAVSTTSVRNTYRQVQESTLNQLLSLLTTLHFKDHYQEPDEITCNLIAEMLFTPDQVIQLKCLDIIKFMLIKFTSRKTMQFATGRAVWLFNHTAFVQIAVAVLDVFMFAASNLVSIINDDSVEPMDIDAAVLKFSGQQSIMEKYAQLNELLMTTYGTGIRTQSKSNQPQEMILSKNSSWQSLPGNVTEQSTLLGEAIAIDTVGDGRFTSNNNNTTGAKYLSRLVSMLLSEDASVRKFGLQKLFSRLQKLQREYYYWQGCKRDNNQTQQPFPPDEHHTSKVTLPAASRLRGDPSFASLPEIPDSIPSSIIASKDDIRTVADCLFKCLKASLDSRAAAVHNGKKESLLQAHQKRNVEKHLHDVNNSVASLLIDEALSSAQTDVEAVLLVLQCLFCLRSIDLEQYLTVLTKVSVARETRASPSKSSHQLVGTSRTELQAPETLQQFLDLGNEIMRVLVSQNSGHEMPRLLLYSPHILDCARDYSRLLLTLTHANDSRIAEVCADLMSQVLLHVGTVSANELPSIAILTERKKLLRTRAAVEAGWTTLGLNIDADALGYFLRPANTAFLHRTQLSLSYLVFLSRSVSSSAQPGPDSSSSRTTALGKDNDKSRRRPKSSISFEDLMKWDSAKLLHKLMAIALNMGVEGRERAARRNERNNETGNDVISSSAARQSQLLHVLQTTDALPQLPAAAQLMSLGTVSTFTRVCALDCLSAAAVFNHSRSVMIEADTLSRLVNYQYFICNV
jgi:hypothetical protein